MKAITYDRYGSADVLAVRDVPKPTPGEGEVLLSVRAAALNPLDWHYMRGEPYMVRLASGLRKPKARGLGVDVAGRVDEVGRGVTQFKIGDEVFGRCRGACAEYATTLASALVPKPSNVTFEEAAAVPIAAITALQGLRDRGRIQVGQQVLINGAGGGVGTFAVQIAKTFGAEVTGVCSARNVERVRAIGADQVIDYAQEDFTVSERRYDLILDCAGNHSLRACRRALRPSGVYVAVGGPTGKWIGPLLFVVEVLVLSWFSKQDLVMMLARPSEKDMTFLHGLLAAGRLKSQIDRTYPLSDVPQAVRYLEEGHTRGKVVITLGQGDAAAG